MSLNALGVISRALRLLGTLGGGETVGPDDATDALIAFNAMKRAMFGTLIGPRLSSIGLTGTAGQAENGGEYAIPGGAAFTLTAPGNPRPGARFGVVDATLDWGSHWLTVVPNGRLINGAGSNLVIGTAGQNTRWWFRGDTANWVAEADTPSLTSAIEFPDPIIAYLPYMLAVAMATEMGQDLGPEVGPLAIEGRAIIARSYGRRGRAQPEGPLGLAAPPQPAQQG